MSRRFGIMYACVALLIVVSLMLSFSSCKRSSYNAEYENKLSELICEKQRLINEKNQLDITIEQELGNASFMSFAFTEIDEALYTEVYPMMCPDGEEIDLVGVMALSKDELPGMDGNISMEQYLELASVGWGTALYWDGMGELEGFIVEMQSLLGELEIDLPASVIFAKGSYDTSCDEMLTRYGIKNAVHSGEGDLKYIEKTAPDGVWHPGRIGWRWLGESTRLKKSIEANDGYALFEICFTNSWENTHTSFYAIEGDAETDEQRKDKFYSMLQSFRESIAAGEIEVRNIDDTRARFTEYFDKLALLESEKEKRLAEIESLINDVTRRMTELYNEYY